MKKRKINLLIYWVFAIISFECTYKMTVFKNIVDSDFNEMLLFCLPIALVIYMVTTTFSEKINKILSTTLLAFLYFIFFAQMVYFQVYNSVFSIYSMTNGGQVFEFWRTILSTIAGSLYNYICLTIPFILFFVFKKKFFDFKRNNIGNISLYILIFFMFVNFSTMFLFFDNKAIYSSYNLFFNTHAPILSAKKFGLLTTMNLDLERSIFGLKEKKIEIDIGKDNNVPEEADYNTIDINFEELINNEKNDTIKTLHNYFSNVIGTKKNNYTGMFKGKNVVFFLAESFDSIAIDKDLTPTLYRLANSGFNFKNYYSPLYPASTADGEFRTEWSLISSRGDTLTLYAAKDVYSPYLFINSFKDYNVNVYHNYNGDYYSRRLYFKSLGYPNFKACYYGLNLPCGTFHESDLDMVDITTDEYMDSETPFFTYYITLSGHLSYAKATNKIVQKNWDLVEDLPYSDKVKGYIAGNIEVDRALELLIKRLEEAGKLDDTVIVLTPDHYPYGLSNANINEVSAIDRDDAFELYHSDLIIWNNRMETIEVDKVGSNPDVLPTILNLFGIEYDSRLIMGQDLLSDKEGLVVLANRSWISDKVKYNSVTSEIIPRYEGIEVDEEYIAKLNNLVDNQFKISNMVLQNNYYMKLFKPNEEDKGSNYVKSDLEGKID